MIIFQPDHNHQNGRRALTAKQHLAKLTDIMQLCHFQLLSLLTPSLRRISTLLCIICLSACQPEPETNNIKDQGVLKVISRNGPTTFYEDKNGMTGFEHELVRLFAEHEGLKVELQTVYSLNDIFSALEAGDAHLAAAGLTITEARKQRMAFGPPYMDVKQYVLYHNRDVRPKRPEDIINSRILVMANSSHSEILSSLGKAHPNLDWNSATDVESIDLLDLMMAGELDYTLMDSSEFIANKSFYPRIKIAFEVGQSGKLAWALPIKHSDYLANALKKFFNKIDADGTLTQLEERFYSHNEQLSQIDSRTFARAVEKKLPRYADLIQSVAQQHHIDWRLLAAISYQESHWNPRARSPTGVRGMMMLTLPTAREMKVKNRLDAQQSLDGGARYFKKTLRLIPDSIKEPDRTWMALAAYNVGRGHLEDARIITQKRGGDPTKWNDVKKNLPLLSKRRWYINSKHGYARGKEPVQYVQNIRHFYNYLEWSELSKNRTPPPKQIDQYIPSNLQQPFNAL